MKKLSTREIREMFLSFFVEKKHLRIDHAPLLPINDPTLLFINSGMAPLKRYFLGKAVPPSARLCNVQPCIRTIDIDEVGDRHHLTLFEMLGSWSIGDYYKEGAIELAYELLVGRFGFDPKRLFATTYKGDSNLSLPPDLVSASAWEKVGMPRDHIVPLGEDNFWGPAGTTGPCGPCTEVFYDTGSAYGADYVPGGHFDTKNRYIEIWNAGVFMEFNKTEQGAFEPLPIKSVDTGSGLERMAFVMGGHQSAYETDVLSPVMKSVMGLFGKTQVLEENRRIISDHIRAATFIMAEGVLPSNEGHGYIPRRLIRKCVAISAQAGLRGVDFAPAIEAAVSSLDSFYPLIDRKKDTIIAQIRREVADFEPVIKSGLERLEQDISGSWAQVYSGKKAFQFAATHGVPIEIIRSFLKEKQFGLDEKGYQACVAEHQAVSRRGHKFAGEASGAGERSFSQSGLKLSPTRFVGYDATSVKTIVTDIQPSGEEHLIVLESSPFYAEGGGQVGDTGWLKDPQGGVLAEILDTKKQGDTHVHVAKLKVSGLKPSQEVVAEVDAPRRNRIMPHHTGTHLMNEALKRVLGPHIRQAGSYVGPDKLRFDFTHPKGLTPDELAKVEAIVNDEIRADHPVIPRQHPVSRVAEFGATTLLGEDYGSDPRFLLIGPKGWDAPKERFSLELCGGTHVKRTSEILAFKVIRESSVSSGVRRIEAVCGPAVAEYEAHRDAERLNLLDQLKSRNTVLRQELANLGDRGLAVTKILPIPDNETDLRSQNRNFENTIKQLKGQALAHLSDAGRKTLEAKGVKLAVQRLEGADPKSLRALSDKVKSELGSGLVFLAAPGNGKLSFILAATPDLAAKGVDAAKLAKDFAAANGGSAGGRADFAQGGAADTDWDALVQDLVSRI